jgi:ornithine carbamoyltransferase
LFFQHFPMSPVPVRHFLQFADFSSDELAHLFARTRWIKDRFKRYELYQPLRDRTLAMVFEKASTRTRVSFEAGMNQLGGIAINLNRHDTQLSRGEPIEDVARVIGRMVDVVMIRTFGQDIIERFAAHSRVPVINGLTNEHHPCQILADVYTFIEHRGDIRGRTVAWIGDANNMLTSWLQAAAVLDFRVHVSSPVGYEVKRSRPARRGREPLRELRRPARRLPRRRPRHDRRVDEHGLRGRERRAPARVRRLAGRRRHDAHREARRAVHALPARAPRRGRSPPR